MLWQPDVISSVISNAIRMICTFSPWHAQQPTDDLQALPPAGGYRQPYLP